MKRLTSPLFLLALLLANASLAFAAVTTKIYSGSYNGIACTVQMNWLQLGGTGAD